MNDTLAPPAEADSITLEWVANPRQQEVLTAIKETPEGEYLLCGYGGAAGGAKTNLLANVAINIGLDRPGSRTLIGRNQLTNVKSTTLAEFDLMCPGRLISRKYDSPPIRRYIVNRGDPNWPVDPITEKPVESEVIFMGVQDAKASFEGAGGLGSENFGFVLLDEAQEIAKADIVYLFTRMRHRPEKKWGMIVGFNPFPSTVTNWFMRGELEGMEALYEIGNVHVKYVPARMADNPHLPPGYENMLRATLSTDPYLFAVMIEGRSEAVPNAIFGELNQIELQQQILVNEVPTDTVFTRGGTAWDWGTSVQHKSAGAVGATDESGVHWILDAWESPTGSTDELGEKALDWKTRFVQRRRHASTGRDVIQRYITFARYDSSQGALKDELNRVFKLETEKAVHHVDARIAVMRAILGTQSPDYQGPKKAPRVRFNMASEGVRKLFHFLTMYHRKDDGTVYQFEDDMVDAVLYLLYALEQPQPNYSSLGRPTVGLVSANRMITTGV